MNPFTPATLTAGLLVLSQPSLPAQAPAVPAKPPNAIIITNAPVGGEGAKGRSLTPYLSSGISDILRMVHAGVEEPVILAFVQSSTVAYHPSAREVIYLREVGVSQAVITALLKRGGELRDRAAEVEREERNRIPQPAPAAPAPPTQPESPPPSASVAPGTVVYTTPTPTYVASAPVYVGSPGYYYGAYSYGYPYRSCYPGYYYGNYGYRSCYPYYGSPYVGFGYRSGYGFSVGFGYGGYRGYGYGYGGHRYGYGGHGYGYGGRGYGYRPGIRYTGASYRPHR